MVRVYKKIFNSFRHALHGIRYAYHGEQSFRLEVRAGIILIVVGYVAWPLAENELLFLVLSYFLILSFELVNTALERSLERLHPEEHELIRESKDLASAAVLMSVIFSGAVVIVILLSHFLL